MLIYTGGPDNRNTIFDFENGENPRIGIEAKVGPKNRKILKKPLTYSESSFNSIERNATLATHSIFRGFLNTLDSTGWYL